MRRLIPLLMIICLLFSTTIAFADNTDDPSRIKELSLRRVARISALQSNQEKLNEIRTVTKEIQANRTIILDLKADARDAFNQAKLHLKELRENKDSLTDAQILLIKEHTSRLKELKRQMIASAGIIRKIQLELRVARLDRDSEKILDCLKRIKTEQDTRIRKLHQIIKQLNLILVI